jgi:tripartite-type tricarboxylate transporter receptor subunit TctC
MLTRRVALALLAMPALARAQGAYPDRPVRIIVPFAPGGSSDFIARILQPHLGEALGQPVVVENRAGAAGNVGMEAAARAAPDGYTLFLGNVGTMAINPSVFARSLKLDPQKDFAPISLVATTPDALVVHPSLPVHSVAEFVAYAKANPGKLNFGTPGAGSANRLEMELLRERAGGLDMVHVPYVGGAGQAVTAGVAGDVQCQFVTLSSAIGQVQAGRLRCLAVTIARRVPALPEVPTMEQAGFPGFVAGSWQGFAAPAGTAPAIVARWAAMLREAMARADVQQRLRAAGTEPEVSGSPEEFARYIADETQRWGAVVRRVNATAD